VPAFPGGGGWARLVSFVWRYGLPRAIDHYMRAFAASAPRRHPRRPGREPWMACLRTLHLKQRFVGEKEDTMDEWLPSTELPRIRFRT